MLLIETAKGVAMKNAMALGALLAVFSLSYSYGDSKPKNANKKKEDISRVEEKGINHGKNVVDQVEDAVE